jgi:hypothetical protein
MASRNHEVDIARFFHQMTKHSSALDATRRTRPGSSSVANARRCLPSVAYASDPRLVISSVFRCGAKYTVSSSGVTKAAVARHSE